MIPLATRNTKFQEYFVSQISKENILGLQARDMEAMLVVKYNKNYFKEFIVISSPSYLNCA